jgi:hypothetical protein
MLALAMAKERPEVGEGGARADRTGEPGHAGKIGRRRGARQSRPDQPSISKRNVITVDEAIARPSSVAGL